MKQEEVVLINIINSCNNINVLAFILESYVQQYGPLSNEAGDIIKDRIEELK